MKNAWNCGEISGSYQFKLARSLKLLKPVLRQLNKRNFSGISVRVKEQAAKVSELQRLLLTCPDQNTASEEHEARVKWQSLITAEEKFYRQKSRVRWLHLGDRNTDFFHRTVAQRATRNHIHALRDSMDHVLTSSDELKSHSADYFQGVIGSTDMEISPTTVPQLQSLLQFRCTQLRAEKGSSERHHRGGN